MGNTNPCSNCMKTNSQVDLSNETNNNQPKAKKNVEHFNPINMFTKASEKPKKISNINKVQALARGAIYRKRYNHSIKKSLLTTFFKLRSKYEGLSKSSLYDKSSRNEPNYKQIISLNSDQNSNKDVIFQNCLKIYPDNSFYFGYVNINNQQHGEGIFYKSNGEKYSGQWKENVFEGWGVWVNEIGDIYIGLFKDFMLTTSKSKNNNKTTNKTLSSLFVGNSTNSNSILSLVTNGVGKKITSNDSVYEGEFLNNLKEGKGKEITTEHVYYGQFLADLKHGIGRLEYKGIKDVYEGEFINNQINGKGKYVWANKETYEGTFINGKMHGRGVYTWPDGSEYIGEYINNLKEGMGEFRWSNGKTFEGPFVNGKPHGMGKMYSKGKNYTCEFLEGRLKSTRLNALTYLGSKNSPFNAELSGIIKNDSDKQSFEELQFNSEKNSPQK